MKKLTGLLAVGLFVLGLGFTSCNKDDEVRPSEPPVHLPTNPENLPIPDVDPY